MKDKFNDREEIGSFGMALAYGMIVFGTLSVVAIICLLVHFLLR